ncbi:HD domain-containing protein [Oribacterium sp. P6A1]|uniref:HD domain-containing protein n=1 Tax=Oribacterium sp. P6A1 TaxID=1410612 RepID=UPI00055C12CD|nr:HD domain-containing protein [Oribacterium sp. P6A1]
MLINREMVLSAFDRYTSAYDVLDIKVKLKIDHTYRVAEICDKISDSLNLSKEDRDIAWLSGMLHDIGRFEQLRRYHTFQDKISCDHAALSAEILFTDGNIRMFTEDSSEDELLEKVIRLHNVYILPDDLSERELLFVNLLRDADKIDIIKVNCITPRSEIYDIPEDDFRASVISQDVYEDITSEHNVDRNHSKTPADYIIGHIGFVYGLVYKQSFMEVRNQGYLDQMLDFQSDVEDTKEKFKKIKETINKYIDRHIG